MPAVVPVSRNAAPITTIEPIVAPTSGMMSKTAMNTASASEYGTPSR